MSDVLTITGYSTALFSTWIFVEQFALLLDAGDGVCAGLLQKSRKIKKVAITHPDRDHLTGLLQLQQLNAREGIPEVFYPADCGSFPALAEFCCRFDPGKGEEVTWTPVKPGESFELSAGLKLRVMANDHFQEKQHLVKSVSYLVIRENRKLKDEFKGLLPAQLAELSRVHGAAFITLKTEEMVLGYSGDTNVASADRWQGCKTLIHESTFLNHADAGERGDRHQHSVLGDVLRLAHEVRPERLVLNHFSSRYSLSDIMAAIQTEARAINLPVPIFIIPPGEVARDILKSAPIWSP